MTEPTNEAKDISEAESLRLLMFMSVADLSRLAGKLGDTRYINEEIDALQDKRRALQERLAESTKALKEFGSIVNRPIGELLDNLSIVLMAKGQKEIGIISAADLPQDTPRMDPTPEGPDFTKDEQTCLVRKGDCSGCPVKEGDTNCRIRFRTNVKEEIQRTQQEIERLTDYGRRKGRGARIAR